MARKKVPSKVEAEVIFKSNRQCCVCNERGDHIHHIDSNNSNNKVDNLAFLCFNCHHEASVTKGLKKGLPPLTIKNFREHWYKVIETNRKNALKNFDNPIRGLSSEQLLTISKNAIIILELEKIKEEYFNGNTDEQYIIINKLAKYQGHTNYRVAVEIFDFLYIISTQTRAGMTEDVALAIFSTILNIFPASRDPKNRKKVMQLSDQCINIGFSIIYDSLIYLNNYRVAMYGLTIIKFIYRMGKEQKIKSLIDKANSTYSEIEETLKRPERDDLQNGLELVKHFKNNLKNGTLSFPPLPDHLMTLVNNQKK